MSLTNKVVNYSRQINNTFDQFTSIAGGALCLGRSLISLILNPAGALSGVINTILGPIMGGILGFKGFLQYQLNRILASTFGVIIGIQQTILNILGAVKFLTSIVSNTILGINARVEYLRDIINGRENCNQIVAQLISCFINKTQGITNDKKLLRTLSNINNLDQSTMNLLYDTFKQDDFTRFVDKYENEAFKLQTQVTKINQLL